MKTENNLKSTPLSQITDEDAIEIACIVLKEKEREMLKEYLKTIGKNILEFIITGEVNSKDFVVASLAITDQLTHPQICMVIDFIRSKGYTIYQYQI